MLTKNRDCLSFFTNCALLLGPVPNLRKALHRHYHRYDDNDIHQTTEALSIISSIIRPGSSPPSSTFLTCTWSLIGKYLVYDLQILCLGFANIWSMICKYLVDNFSSSGIYSTTPQQDPHQNVAHRICLLAGSLPFSYPVHEMLLCFSLKISVK